MPAPKDNVHETTTSTGASDLTLAAVNGRVRFSDSTYGFGTGGTNVFNYFISHRSAAEWEIGTGHMSDANTLVRDTVIISSNANAAVNFSAGTKDVANDARATEQYVLGKHSIWIPAVAMYPRTTNGAAIGSVELSTNKIMLKTLDFDPTTQEFAQFAVRMPKGWNEGTVSFIPVWSHPATATNFGVVWALQAVAISDGDALDAAFGTEQTSSPTGGTTDDLYQGSESSAITIGGTPAENDYVIFQIKRNVSDGSDNLAVDARLHGIVLFYTISAPTDA
jgi:hypothetical protein